MAFLAFSFIVLLPFLALSCLPCILAPDLLAWPIPCRPRRPLVSIPCLSIAYRLLMAEGACKEELEAEEKKSPLCGSSDPSSSDRQWQQGRTAERPL
jgi:hypothetical protein